ncbi:MAG: outer membrane lipoprotein-sorting protein [Gammaproteobacteria bacterium]|nr:outer membrane lipoprotein-sorting protein [Gammaproteobacteria bacterium]
MNLRTVFLTTGLLSLAYASSVSAVDRNLPFPEGTPTATEIAEQVYFANHLYAFDNFSIGAHKSKNRKAVLINRSADGTDNTIAVERHLNNSYDSDGSIKARDLAIFRSGKLKGTGMLVTEYDDPAKDSSYMLWIPSLRKIRRFAQPAHEDSWGGSVFTFGDVTLRKPEHETHELLGKKKMRSCLGAIAELEDRGFRYVQKLPEKSCRNIGKEVYGLKSTTKFPNWWYDYRISLVDTKTFADYRTVYYKDGEMIKIIDRDWGVMEDKLASSDPRALFWRYWYGVDLKTGKESWAVIPERIIEFNRDVGNRFWSERTLRRIKR